MRPTLSIIAFLAAGALASCTASGTAFNPPGAHLSAAKDLVVGMDTNGAAGGTLSIFDPPFSGATVSGIAVGQPVAMAMDAHGNLWVATGATQYSGSYGVVEFKPPFRSSSTPAVVIATSSTGATEGVAFDSSGDLWVSNFNDAVREFKPPLTASSAAATTITNGVRDVAGIAFDKNGDLWISNTGIFYTSALVEYSPPFSNSSSPTVTMPANYDIQAIAFDASGSMYVAGTGNTNVQEYAPPFTDASTPTVTLSPVNFLTIESVATDSSNHLWVSDSGSDAVYEYALPLTGSSTPALTLTPGVSSPHGMAFVR
ncbi:MAG: NHL repeat-containing protein [Candidatus Tyrphobacter sp.]